MANRYAIVLGTLLCLIVTAPVVAQERTWLKYHEGVEMDGQLFAEYTVITTHDDVSPAKKRLLYQDAQGVRLVIRYETDFVDNGGPLTVQSTTISVTTVSGGEVLTFALDNAGQITLSINGPSMSFADAETFPSGVRAQAQQLLLSNASPGFRIALARLASVGSFYSEMLESIGSSLGQLMFAIDDEPVEYTTDPTEVVPDFDPNTTPPGVFEQPFGQAYYQ